MGTFSRYSLLLISLLTALACYGAEITAGPQSPINPSSPAARTLPKIVLYSTSWCPHCREAKEYFRKNSIAFINRDVEEDADAMEALTAIYNSSAVPVIVIGNDEKVLKGFKQDEFEKALAEVKGKK